MLGGPLEPTGYVVIDTSAINLDFGLRNEITRRLFSWCPGVHLQVCVAEVVVLEMVAHYRAALAGELKKQELARQQLSGLVQRPVVPGVPPEDLDSLVAEFETKFRIYLAKSGVRLLPMPAAYSDVRILLDRDLARRKPFTEGKGMRDALLWESVLELCANSQRPLVVISPNTRDFADKAGGVLHDDLLADLAGIGLPRESAEFYPSIEACLQQRFPENREKPAASESCGD